MKVSLQLDIEVPDDINITGLASSVKDMGKDIMKAVIENMQETIVEQMCGKPYSRDSAYERKEKKPRTLRTSLGYVNLDIKKVRKKGSRNMIYPIEDMLGIPKRKRIMNEARIKPMMQAPEQSYRKSVKTVEEHTEIRISKSTLWRDIQGLKLETGKPNIPMDIVFADDTEVKGNEDDPNYVSIVIGRNIKHNKEFLLDFSVNEDWYTIAERVSRKADIRNAYFVCDSEREISNAFEGKVKGIQICHNHAVKYTNYALWSENSPKNFRKKAKYKLHELLCTLQNSVKKHRKDKDFERLKRRIEKTRQGILELAGKFRCRGFDLAANYLENRIEQFMTFAFAAIEGVEVPYTNNREEREMRENAYRTKRIGARWSDRGLFNLGSWKFVPRFNPSWLKKFKKNYTGGGKGYIDFRITSLGGN